MKTYRRHNCNRRHRTWRTLAECMLPRAAWVIGEGPYALISWCDVTTVTLWESAVEAENAKEGIDYLSCGHACGKRHEVVALTRT